MTIYIYDECELKQAVEAISSFYDSNQVFILQGALGAGKTAFVQAFCKVKNTISTASSPTFSLVNEYELENGESIIHMDLYRIEDQAEILDFGFEDYLDNGRYVFIEWPEYAFGLLGEHVDIQISILGDKIRKLECTKYE
jgi:tRNA threonylcarbamoyladenosine biosynthesis protein TsaE